MQLIEHVNLSCLYFNAQSIIGKLESLHASVALFKPDIIGVSLNQTLSV